MPHTQSYSKILSFQNRLSKKVVILEFEIEERSYHNFKRTFHTDRYIDINSWQQIMVKIDDVIGDIISGKKDWKNDPKGKISLHEFLLKLNVSFKILSKEKSKINYEKTEYDLEWFIKIFIKKDRGKSTSRAPSSDENRISTPVESKITKPILVDSQDEDEEIQGKKRLKTDPIPLQKCKTFYDLRKTPMKASVGPMDKFVTQDSIGACPNVTKRNKEKVLKRKNSQNTSQKSPTGSSRPPLESFDPLEMKKVEKFIEKLNEEEKQQENRKDELEDLVILTCEHLKNSELKDFIKSKKDEILNYFEMADTRSKFKIDGIEVKAVIINSSSILTDNQHLFLMKEIQKIRHDEDRGTKDDVLSDIVMPYVRVELFKKEYNFSSEQAIRRISEQEEKRDLFQHSREY